MSASRIPVDLVHESQDPIVAETFAFLKTKAGVGNIHRFVANSPAVFKHFIGLAYALRYETELDPLERELAICCVLERHEGTYELAPHRRMAAICGATEEQIAQVSRPDRDDLFSSRQQAVLRFAAHMGADPAERGDLPDHGVETWLTNRQRIELGFTLALYMGLAHLTGVFDVPLDDFGAANRSGLTRMMTPKST
jgi:alkylhydroperoxidase family enzyme